ncbi:hypothetical protein [Myroides sp. TSA_177.3]|uniref:hypothetical protein n=1 Tax=Myroides sp. TSA_177.3 TaxID=3415650 RepID=UPI0040461700
MKYLKIDNNKGYFRLVSDETSWIEIDKIDKDSLLSLLKLAGRSDEFKMDEYQDELLQNPAHNIIYKNIFLKFNDFIENKTRFKDSVESTYKPALEKYKIEID